MILHSTPHSATNFSLLYGDKEVDCTPHFNVYNQAIKVPRGEQPPFKDSILNTWAEHTMLDIETALNGMTNIFHRESNQRFQRIYDHAYIPDNANIKSLKCIFSFQEHTYGRFVVIRNFFGKEIAAARAKNQRFFQIDKNFYSAQNGCKWLASYDGHLVLEGLTNPEEIQYYLLKQFFVDFPEMQPGQAGLIAFKERIKKEKVSALEGRNN